MMKEIIPLLTAFFIWFNVSGQITPWNYNNTNNIGSTFDAPINYGEIIPKDNSFLVVNGGTLLELSYYGEFIHYERLYTNGSVPGQKDVFFIDEIIDRDSNFTLAARWSDVSGNIYLSTYFEGNLFNLENGILNFDISDVITPNTDTNKPSAIKISPENYLFWGQEWMHKVRVADARTIQLEWRRPIEGGLVTSLKKTCNGYITLSIDGVANHYNEDFNLMWSTDLNHSGEEVSILNDGFVFIGNDSEKGILTRTDLKGNIIWQNSYDDIQVNSMTTTSDEFILVVGKDLLAPFDSRSLNIFKMDTSGKLVWSKTENKYPGTKIIESPYGGYLVLISKYQSFDVSFIDINGDFSSEDNSTIFNDILSINNIETTTANSGRIFETPFLEETGYFFPKDSSTSTISSLSLWLSGVDEFSHTYATTPFYQNNFSPGPVNDKFNGFFFKNWVLRKDIIDEFIEDSKDKKFSNPIPYQLISWPAFGNPNIKYNGNQIQIHEPLAPFIDVNNDGIYNVFDGDYPQMKGDKMLWWIMHANTEVVDNNYLSLGFDIQGSVYAFNCGDSLLQNTVFVDLNIKNNSNKAYTDFNIGLNTSFSLGCPINDYMGTIPERNTYYCYNQYMNDEDGCPYFDNHYGNKVPIQSITLLNHPLSSTNYTAINVINPNSSIPYQHDPSTPHEIHQFMQSIWPGDIHLKKGNDGYDTNGPPIDFAFDGNPTDTNQWSMCQSNFDYKYIQFVASTKQSEMATNQTINLHYGLVTHTDINDLPCPDISQIEPRLQALQDLYDNYLSKGAISNNTLTLGPDQTLQIDEEPITLTASADAISYKWSTGETTPSIEVNQAGIYSIEMTSQLGCYKTDTITIYSSDAALNYQPEKLHVFPNPTEGHLCVILDEHLPIQIELYNMAGQLIQSIETDSFRINSIVPFDLSALSSGVYLLSCKYENGERVAQRVVLGRR